MRKSNLQTLVHVALLIAIEIILSRFCSIATPIVKIGFGFIPIAICGMLYGPLWTGAMAGIADLLGAVLFPIGPYFPGFTLSALLMGVVFGFFLHRQGQGWSALSLAVVLNSVVISLGLTTFWLTIVTGTPFPVLLVPRILQNLVLIPIQLLVLRCLQKPVVYYAGRSVL